MVVRKKILEATRGDGTVAPSSYFAKVREAIQQLPTDEGTEMKTDSESPAAPEPTAGSTTDTSAKKPAGAKAAKKKTPSPKKTAPRADGGTTLATICKRIKMEPRKARRILRTAKVKNPGRWTWPTASEVSKIERTLHDANE